MYVTGKMHIEKGNSLFASTVVILKMGKKYAGWMNPTPCTIRISKLLTKYVNMILDEFVVD
jgi:hypothetical protein